MLRLKDLKAKMEQLEFALQESRSLLDTTKRAMEIAIEDGEDAARKFPDNDGG